MNQNTTSDSSANGSAPSATSLKSLAGAFIAIQAANKAINLQPDLPSVDISGLEDVNKSLATAQKNTAWWTKTVSANVQNQLQNISSHSDLYSGLAPDLEDMISHLKETTNDQSPDGDLLANISDELMVLQDSVRSILYGDSGSQDQPSDGSVMGTYKQLTEYQQKVKDDETTFAGYQQSAASSQTGIAAQIKGVQDDITALRTAISNDQAMVAGGAAAVVTGVVLIVAAVALAPESGGASLAVGAIGVAAVAGGIAAGAYGEIDMGKKQDKVSKDLVKIQNLHKESGSLTAINHASGHLVDHTKTIYDSLGTIITNWQQMDNDIADAIHGIALADSPNELGKWIHNKAEGKHAPSYHAMGVILHSMMVAPQKEWAKAADLGQNLLNGIANVRHVVLPANTLPTQVSIAKAA